MSDSASPISDRVQVIPPEGGERRELRGPSRSGEVVIRVDPRLTGTNRFSMGTQVLAPGRRIPVHRHEAQEEILFVHSGSGVALLDEGPADLPTGATVAIPAGAWHGVENPGAEPLVLVWFISPPGLEEMFREISAPPGEPAPPLVDEEFQEIARRHGMTVRDS
jgi:quercetin dioxygenase-like cupin family protein